MAHRLPSERLPVGVGDLTIEVERVGAWPVAHHATVLVGIYYAAKPGAPELAALRDIYAYFLDEAEPVWNIEDHKGRIAPTVGGMLRLPVDLALSFVEGWVRTIIEVPTAVDAMVPPGELHDELNRRLRAKRRKAA